MDQEDIVDVRSTFLHILEDKLDQDAYWDAPVEQSEEMGVLHPEGGVFFFTSITEFMKQWKT